MKETPAAPRIGTMDDIAQIVAFMSEEVLLMRMVDCALHILFYACSKTQFKKNFSLY
jgi:hypothetical protein